MNRVQLFAASVVAIGSLGACWGEGQAGEIHVAAYADSVVTILIQGEPSLMLLNPSGRGLGLERGIETTNEIPGATLTRTSSPRANGAVGVPLITLIELTHPASGTWLLGVRDPVEPAVLIQVLKWSGAGKCCRAIGDAALPPGTTKWWSLAWSGEAEHDSCWASCVELGRRESRRATARWQRSY